MKPNVYLETSVVSYAVGRLSRDIVVAARQALTRAWWETRLSTFHPYVSAFVLNEARHGDPGLAHERLAAISAFPVLEVTPAVRSLAYSLIRAAAIPEVSVDDALHVAVAAVHGMDFLVTWNFSHLANAERRGLIIATVVAAGCTCPVICTPEELGGDGHGTGSHR